MATGGGNEQQRTRSRSNEPPSFLLSFLRRRCCSLMADTEAGAAAWDWASEIAKTHERIKPYARQTPLDTAFWLSDHLNARVLFKCEVGAASCCLLLPPAASC